MHKIAVLGALLGAMSAPVLAAEITWNGNGTDETGVCKNLIVDPSVTGQNWLFVLTSANTAITPSLTATFDNPTGTMTVGASKVNKNTVQFSVNTAPYALLQSAFAIDGTLGKSVLTVSHCEVGIVSQWCSPGYWKNAQQKAWDDVTIAENSIYKDALYLNFFAADTLKGSSSSLNPTLFQVLSDPATFGGTATNLVGDLLSAAHPDVLFDGNVRTPDSCPINNAGYLPTAS